MRMLLNILLILFALQGCAADRTDISLEAGDSSAQRTPDALPEASALHAFNDSLYDALSPSHLFALSLQLFLLFSLLFLVQRMLARWNAAHPESQRRTRRWLPAIRLAFVLVGALLIVRALLPDHPTARAVVVAGVLIAVLWASRDVLRNAAAGAVLIAGHAVEVGQYLKVGEYEGLVVAVTLRGIELESPDGTHTFVPGLALHTNPAVHAHDHGRAGPITLHCHIPDDLELAPESANKLCRRLALLSPRRAPGSPVIAHLDSASRDIWPTATPFDHREAQALETELTGKIRVALTPGRKAQGDLS